jgi:hypothetical protein
MISLTWDSSHSEEVEEARKKFEEHTKKGWIAFVVARDGKKTQVYSFDPEAEKIVLAPIVEGG